MKELTPQILAMYLGTWAQTRADGKHVISGSVIHEYATHLRDIWPILRPLSDMTEEEKKKLVRIEIKDDVTITRTDLYGFTYKIFGSPEYDYQQAYGGLSGEQFAYLLSKSFDLFGLIDSGLAIEKEPVQGE